jgi:MFS family permease
VVCLGLAQTLAWASSYYLPAMLAIPMARDLGVSATQVFAAFSFALVISALLGPRAGRAIDGHGGGPVLALTNVLFALGLAVMATSEGAVQMWLAWTLMGVAMGAGLYDAAFAAFVRLYGPDARRAITGITLIAGLASTVGWPLTAWLEIHHGWRTACWVWAFLHLAVALPLNLALPRGAQPQRPVAQAPSLGQATDTGPPGWMAWALSAVFALVWFISTAMATHLPALLQMQGLGVASALAVAALVGPAQVAGRLLEFGLLRRVHPLRSAQLACLGHPLGAVGLWLVGVPWAWPFALLHGAGNGILTIAKGTLPLVLFGAHGYGQRQGWITAPARLSQALAPLLFGALIERQGGAALAVSASLGMLSAMLLMWIAANASKG